MGLQKVLAERNAEARRNTWSKADDEPNRRDQAFLRACLLRQWLPFVRFTDITVEDIIKTRKVRPKNSLTFG